MDDCSLPFHARLSGVHHGNAHAGARVSIHRKQLTQVEAAAFARAQDNGHRILSCTVMPDE